MSNIPNTPADADSLRVRATSQLTGGNTAHARASSLDALTVLHRLAASPATADSALALLHELQVHQVELDMQAEELRESRIEIESELRWHNERYDLQPAGLFTLDGHCIVQEMNLAGARMLGVEREQGIGLALDKFLVPASGASLRTRLMNADEGDGSVATALGRVELSDGSGALQAHVTGVPKRALYLVMLTNASD